MPSQYRGAIFLAKRTLTPILLTAMEHMSFFVARFSLPCRIVLLTCCALALFCAGCGGGKSPDDAAPSSGQSTAHSPEEIVWNYRPKGIAINIKATTDLNFDDNQAHTTFLCVYQLSNTTAFKTLSSTSDGISSLLQCKPFDPGVVSAESVIVSPGHVMGLVYDRMEDAKFVAIVAGYVDLDPHKVTRVKAVPIEKETTGSLLWKEDMYYPGKLEMAFILGSHGLQQIISEGEHE